MNKITNNWNIGPFLRWWDKKEEKEKKFNQLTKKQLAYITWEAAIDYYIDNVEEKSLPFASMDDLYDDDDPMDWRY